MDSINLHLAQFLKRNKLDDNQFLIAFSGGLDSSVLLHAFCEVKKTLSNIQLTAIHVHHGLNQQADAWLAHCQAVCAVYDVELICESVEINRSGGESLEDCARKLRYEKFAEHLNKGTYLCVAQHQNDQAETLLLQLIRGTGINGLAAMPEQKSFQQGFLIRPLLPISRAQLEKFARLNKLSWCEDSSNQDCSITRNAIRHQVLPLLSQLNSAAIKNIARSAAHMQEARGVLNDVVANDFTQCCLQQNKICLNNLKKLSIARQKLCLRHWFMMNEIKMPSAKLLDTIIQQIIFAKEDAQPQLDFSGISIRRFNDVLYCLKQDFPQINDSQINWDLKCDLDLPGDLGQLIVQDKLGEGLSASLQKVSVCFRRGGEEIYLNGCHQNLKNLLQVWQVPPWERNRIPLLFYQQQLIAVVGYAFNVQFGVVENEIGKEIIWQKKPCI